MSDYYLYVSLSVSFFSVPHASVKSRLSMMPVRSCAACSPKGLRGGIHAALDAIQNFQKQRND